VVPGVFGIAIGLVLFIVALTHLIAGTAN
jgi:hypothetical protein